jgi:hypothetical protein
MQRLLACELCLNRHPTYKQKKQEGDCKDRVRSPRVAIILSHQVGPVVERQ